MKCNDREIDKSERQQSLPKVDEILRRFMAVVVSSAFRKSLRLHIVSFPPKIADDTFCPPFAAAQRARALKTELVTGQAEAHKMARARIGKGA